MQTIYLDIFSGVSGDLFLGALLDLGVDFHQLERELLRLQLRGYHLHVQRQRKAGIEGMKFDVHLDSDHHHEPAAAATVRHRDPHPHTPGQSHHHDRTRARSFAQVRDLIDTSPLSAWVRQRSLAVFGRLAAAEGKIHGQAPDEVHFHEVGAVDSIVDIVGACIALEMLGQPRLLAAPVVDGTGWIDCAHGRFPIPAPATMEILATRGIAMSQCDEPHELVTPTGAALLAEFVDRFGPMRNLAPAKIGYGLGTREHQTRPNVLRAVLGETLSVDPAGPREHAPGAHDWESDAILTLQTNLDDINSEILGRFVEITLNQGALDVFYTPIQMKKNRPGVLLTVLCPVEEADRFTELILRETSAFGVRRHTCDRRKLRREVVAVKTPYGEVAVKLGRLDGQIVQTAPEFDSCKQLADQAGVPLRQVYEAALQALPR